MTQSVAYQGNVHHIGSLLQFREALRQVAHLLLNHRAANHNRWHEGIRWPHNLDRLVVVLHRLWILGQLLVSVCYVSSLRVHGDTTDDYRAG